MTRSHSIKSICINFVHRFMHGNLRKVLIFAYKKLKYTLESFCIFLFARHYKDQSTNWNQIRITESAQDPYVREIMFGNMQRWKEQEEIYCQLVTAAEPVLFDIGANIGFVSLLMSKVQGSKIYSFEPVSKTFQYLQKNIEQNKCKNISAFPVGFSDKEEKLFIGLPTKNQHVRYARKNKKTGLFSVYAQQNGKVAERYGEIATFTTLDIFCEKNGIQKINYLKIDVEGHELNVLQGGMTSIKKFRPICQVEFHPTTMHIANKKPKEILDFFKENGYLVTIFENKQFKQIDLDRIVKDYNTSPVELYCFPENKAS